MCRVLYLPKKCRPPLPILEEWLWSLEKSFGGDGNGYATRKEIVKGTKLKTDECAAALHAAKGPVLFHTRKTSIGGSIDELCHPFDTTKGTLIHNGHWTMGAFTAGMLAGKWSDTKVAAEHIKLYSWKSFIKKCNAGVWLHLTPNGLQVLYESGDLHVEMASGALCSEPCANWGRWAKVAKGSYQGRVDMEWPEVKATKSYSSQGSYLQDYDESEGMFYDLVERRLEASERYQLARDTSVSANTRELFGKLCDYPRCYANAEQNGRCRHHMRAAPKIMGYNAGVTEMIARANHHPASGAVEPGNVMVDMPKNVQVTHSRADFACAHITPERYLPDHMRETA